MTGEVLERQTGAVYYPENVSSCEVLPRSTFSLPAPRWKVFGQETEAPQIRLQPNKFVRWSLTISENASSREEAAAARKTATADE